ncbi:UNVERIFIED_CONTAM: hypothetical protein FKN15_029819 [Acipenser sinensis]
MDQLHEELKEPECGAESDREERRDGDRSPSEDEFLSCDSGASSDRGEGGEGILIQDESGGIRGGISEKERLKERRVSGSPRRGGSQEMDEDADIDTAAEEGGATRAGDSEDPPPNSVSKQNHRAGADYGQISEETWNYLFSIYGGGPEIAVRQSVSQPDTESLHGEHKIEAETRAL